MLDLVIVANFYQLGNGFTQNAEKYGFLSLLIYYAKFAPIYDRWVDATILLNKFDTGNTYSMWSLFVFTLLNRSLSLLDDGDMKPFAFCIMLSIGGAMAFNLYVASIVPCARVSTITWVACNAVYLGMWYIVWMTENSYIAIAAWSAALFTPQFQIYSYFRTIIAPLAENPSGRNIRIPIDVELMAERLGLIIVLAIGEVMMTTVKSSIPHIKSEGDLVSLPPDLTHLRPFLSVVLAIGLAGHTKLAYFDTYGCPGEKERGVEMHAFKVSVMNSIFYMRFHMVAVMSIVLSATMIEIGDEEYGKGTLSFDTRLISGVAFAGINASFGILREQHKYRQSLLKNEKVSRLTRLFVLSGVCSLQIFGAVFIPISDPLLLQFMGQALFAANIFFEELCSNAWLHDPCESHKKPIFTDHTSQVRSSSTSAGGLTHIATYGAVEGTSKKSVASEKCPLLTIVN